MGKTCSCMPHIDVLILVLLVIFFLYIVYDFKEAFENEENISVVTNENTFSVTNNSRNYTLSRTCPHARDVTLIGNQNKKNSFVLVTQVNLI